MVSPSRFPLTLAFVILFITAAANKLQKSILFERGPTSWWPTACIPFIDQVKHIHTLILSGACGLPAHTHITLWHSCTTVRHGNLCVELLPSSLECAVFCCTVFTAHGPLASHFTDKEFCQLYSSDMAASIWSQLLIQLLKVCLFKL